MVAVVIAEDALFFRNHGWQPLMAKVGIVVVLAASYFRFITRP